MRPPEMSLADLLALADSHAVDPKVITHLMNLRAWAGDVKVDHGLLRTLVIKYAEAEQRLASMNRALIGKQTRLQEDLEAAAEIQRALLPASMPLATSLEAAMAFHPCEKVGGDLVQVVPYDDRHWLAYIVDVAGHGPRAAMITVSVAQFLQRSSGLPFLQPTGVMAALEKEYPVERFRSFFTIIYGVVDLIDQTFTFSNAGHPPPVLLRRGTAPTIVSGSGPMLGLGLLQSCPEMTVDLSRSGCVLLYTDGLTECSNGAKIMFGEDRLAQTLKQSYDCLLGRVSSQSSISATEERPSLGGASSVTGGMVDTLMAEAKAFMDGQPFQDDLALLALKGIP